MSSICVMFIDVHHRECGLAWLAIEAICMRGTLDLHAAVFSKKAAALGPPPLFSVGERRELVADQGSMAPRSQVDQGVPRASYITGTLVPPE